MAKTIGFKIAEPPVQVKGVTKPIKTKNYVQLNQYILLVMYITAILLVLATYFEITCFYCGVGLWGLAEIVGDVMENQQINAMRKMQEQ